MNQEDVPYFEVQSSTASPREKLDAVDANRREPGCKFPNVVGIPRHDDGTSVRERRGDDERVDRVSGGQPRGVEQRARALRDGSGQINHADRLTVQELVDRGVEAHASTNLGENCGRNPHDGATLVRDPRDCARSEGKRTTLTGVGERVERLGVQDQRFGQARLARRNSASGTGPKASSSSSRNWPSASRSSSRATAWVTKDESPRRPARFRAATAILRGMLIDSFSAGCGIRVYYPSSNPCAKVRGILSFLTNAVVAQLRCSHPPLPILLKSDASFPV